MARLGKTQASKRTTSISALFAQEAVRKKCVHGVPGKEQSIVERHAFVHLLAEPGEDLVFRQPNQLRIDTFVLVQNLFFITSYISNCNSEVLIRLTRIQQRRPLHQNFDILSNKTSFLTDLTLCSVQNGVFTLI